MRKRRKLLGFSGAIVDDIIPFHSLHETENKEFFTFQALFLVSLFVLVLSSQELKSHSTNQD